MSCRLAHAACTSAASPQPGATFRAWSTRPVACRRRVLARAAERAGAAATTGADAVLVTATPRRRTEAAIEEEDDDETGLTVVEMAWSALLALPAWLAPYEGAARDAPSDTAPLSLADDAMGDAGLALWLAKRSRR